MSTNAFPSWWAGAGIDAKAAWLVQTGRARSYDQACSQLARMRRPKRLREPVAARLPYKDD
jgi:hypothetical protein